MEKVGEDIYVKVAYKSFILEKKLYQLNMVESSYIQDHLIVFNILTKFFSMEVKIEWED